MKYVLSFLSFTMLLFLCAGCQAQVPQVKWQVNLNLTAPTTCTTAKPCTYDYSRAAGTICPATTGTAYALVGTTASQVTTYADTGVTAGQSYCYIAQTIQAGAPSAPSLPSNVVPVPANPAAPGAPSASIAQEVSMVEQQDKTQAAETVSMPLDAGL
jgi:hypothetical protein